MKRTPIRSVSLIGAMGNNNLAQFPNIGGKEFNSFLESLPDMVTRNTKAVVFHLSNLNIGKQHQDYLKIVQAVLERAYSPYSGRVFSTQHGDVVCIFESKSSKMVKPTANEIRTLFGEDVFSTPSDKDTEFYKIYNLQTKYKEFSSALTKLINTQNSYLAPKGTDKWIRSAKRHVSPLSPQKYKEICEKLAKTDINQCIRSQAICTISDKQPPEIVSRELYIQISELQKLICPNVDLLTNPWLFQSLTHYFDMAVLSALNQKKSKYKSSNLNLNLNIPSLLSDEFIRWEEGLTDKQRLSITIELQKMDIFTDMGAYKFIWGHLKSKGFRFLLDGLTPHTLQLIDWAKLGVDYVKVYWSEELIHDKKLAKPFAKAPVILAHCDSPQSIAWGQEQGIKLFQGWHVDQLLMPGYSG